MTITLPANQRCRPTRSFSVRAKIAKGGTITSVEVYVNKRRKLRVTGAKALKAIRVSGLPRGRYTLEVRVKTRDGRTERLSADLPHVHALRSLVRTAPRISRLL